MTHFALIYEYGPDILEQRKPHRNPHLKHAWAAQERGELLLGGAFDPVVGGMMLFQCDDPDVPRRFAQEDPYVLAGLVLRWRVHKWDTVIGAGATRQLRPDA
jgi:uncharacterized protein